MKQKNEDVEKSGIEFNNFKDWTTTISFGKNKSKWYRIKQILKWIWTGECEFPFRNDDNLTEPR